MAGPLLVMVIAMENPVPQSLLTVYATWHTGAAAAGAAGAALCPGAAMAAVAATTASVPHASRAAADSTAPRRNLSHLGPVTRPAPVPQHLITAPPDKCESGQRDLNAHFPNRSINRQAGGPSMKIRAVSFTTHGGNTRWAVVPAMKLS